MPKQTPKSPVTLLTAELPPEISNVSQLLSVLESARKNVTEALAQHEAHADRMEAILAYPDQSNDLGEVGALQAQIQLAHARHHHAVAAVDRLENELAVAMSAAIPRCWRVITAIRDAIIERTAELPAPWFAKKGDARRVAEESAAAKALFNLRWQVEWEKNHLSEPSARRLFAHFKTLAEIETRHFRNQS